MGKRITIIFVLMLLLTSLNTQTAVFARTQAAPSIEWQEVILTAYCPCQSCCGKASENGITASGEKARPNYSIAADKSIPFGTVLFLPGIGLRTVVDRGGAIHRNRIDLYFDTHQEALDFGVQTTRITTKGELPCVYKKLENKSDKPLMLLSISTKNWDMLNPN